MQKKNDDSIRDLVHLIRGKTSNILDGLEKGSIKNNFSTIIRRLNQVKDILESIAAPATKVNKGEDHACSFATTVTSRYLN